MRMTTSISSLVLGSTVLLAACGDSKSDTAGITNPNPSMAGETEVGTDSMGTTTSNQPTTTPSPTATDPTTPTTVEPPDDTTAAGSGFIQLPDGGGNNNECDIWKQDCPPDQKCMPWASDGGSSWNAVKCTELDAMPGKSGDPCTVEGSAVSGIDSCDVGLMCWFVDDMNQGVCIDMCTGSPDAPMCPSGKICDESNGGAIIVCLDTCDPLAQSCPEGQICFFDGDANFICDFDASGDGGNYGDPCAFINVCSYGLFCAAPETVPNCQGGDGCCSPYCDLSEPNTCPGMDEGQVCVPWYAEGAAPPGQEDIGACAIPQ